MAEQLPHIDDLLAGLPRVFVPKRSDARFCSTRCRVASHRLPEEG